MRNIIPKILPILLPTLVLINFFIFARYYTSDVKCKKIYAEKFVGVVRPGYYKCYQLGSTVYCKPEDQPMVVPDNAKYLGVLLCDFDPNGKVICQTIPPLVELMRSECYHKSEKQTTYDFWHYYGLYKFFFGK